MKKRVALVGASMRVSEFIRYLRTIQERWEICGVFDIDSGKMQGFEQKHQLHCPYFTDFDALCDQTHPDLVIITTVDATHYRYVVQALDRQISVVSEKPLCTTPEQCRAIIAAQSRNPEVRAITSHNARYSPHCRKIKELISSGAIGKIRTVNFVETLDMKHGSSYFRRWNGTKKNSGGLQIHKASHHFDEIQWMLNSRAQRVWATGAQIAYGPKHNPFTAPHGTHCHSCQLDCPYRVDYQQDRLSSENLLFFQFATPNSYTPDRCIFGPDIDIEDFISAGIAYENGTFANYNLIAHSSYEGQTISYQGETGRLDCRVRRYRKLNENSDIHDANSEENLVEVELCRFGHGAPEKIPLTHQSGSHGGADYNLFSDIFAANPPADLPTLADGLQAVLVGCAVNASIQLQQPIDVQTLLTPQTEEDK